MSASRTYVKHLKIRPLSATEKKIKVPKRTDQQKNVLGLKCRKLSKIFREKEVFIDEESYLRFRNVDLAGNAGYYTSDSNQTPDSVKLKRVAKFGQKLQVWVAISSSGMSKHYIVPSGQAVNETVYIEKCLKARLVPYINNLQKMAMLYFDQI